MFQKIRLKCLSSRRMQINAKQKAAKVQPALEVTDFHASADFSVDLNTPQISRLQGTSRNRAAEERGRVSYFGRSRGCRECGPRHRLCEHLSLHRTVQSSGAVGTRTLTPGPLTRGRENTPVSSTNRHVPDVRQGVQLLREGRPTSAVLVLSCCQAYLGRRLRHVFPPRLAGPEPKEGLFPPAAPSVRGRASVVIIIIMDN